MAGKYIKKKSTMIKRKGSALNLLGRPVNRFDYGGYPNMDNSMFPNMNHYYSNTNNPNLRVQKSETPVLQKVNGADKLFNQPVTSSKSSNPISSVSGGGSKSGKSDGAGYDQMADTLGQVNTGLAALNAATDKSGGTKQGQLALSQVSGGDDMNHMIGESIFGTSQILGLFDNAFTSKRKPLEETVGLYGNGGDLSRNVNLFAGGGGAAAGGGGFNFGSMMGMMGNMGGGQGGGMMGGQGGGGKANDIQNAVNTGMALAANSVFESQNPSTGDLKSRLYQAGARQFNSVTNQDLANEVGQRNMNYDHVGIRDIRNKSLFSEFNDSLGASAKGYEAGSAFGPWGAGIGGVVGGTSSLVGSIIGRHKAVPEKHKINKAADVATARQGINLLQAADRIDKNNNFNIAANYGVQSAYGGPLNTMADGGKIDPTFIDRINTSKANFISRLKDPNRKTIKNWENKDQVSTHKLSYATDDSGRAIVFPMVQEVNGKLMDYSNPKYKKDWRAAMNNAIANKDTLMMSPSQAEEFTTQYKNYYPGFNEYASGGKIHINPANKGKLTATSKRTGKSFSELAHSSDPLTRKRAIFALNARKWNHKAYGGNLFKDGGNAELMKTLYNNNNFFASGGDADNTDFSNGVTEYNEGGTHEENPNGGVPVGTDSKGTPNLVEQGEVRYKDYIYSNRLSPSKEVLDKVGLSPLYSKYSFAKCAEILSRESKERPNDPISQNGLNSLMSRLKDAQDMTKEGTEKVPVEQSQPSSDEQVQPTNNQNIMQEVQGENPDEEPQENTQEEVENNNGETQQYAEGGDLFNKYNGVNILSLGTEQDPDNLSIVSPDHGLPKKVLINSKTRKPIKGIYDKQDMLLYGDDGYIYTPNGTVIARPNKDPKSKTKYPYLRNDYAVVNRFGAKVSYPFDPKRSYTSRYVTYPDASYYTGEIHKMNGKVVYSRNGERTNINPDKEVKSTNELIRKIYENKNNPIVKDDNNPVVDNTGTPKKDGINSGSSDHSTKSKYTKSKSTSNINSQEQALNENLNTSAIDELGKILAQNKEGYKVTPTITEGDLQKNAKAIIDNQKEQEAKDYIDQFSKNNTGKSWDKSKLRYAPVVGSAIGVISDLMGLTNKPNYDNENWLISQVNSQPNVNYKPSGNYLGYNPVDRDYALNKFNSAYSASREQLADTANGNRANLQAQLANLNNSYLGGLGDNEMKIELQNIANRNDVDKYNNSLDQANAEMAMKAQMANVEQDRFRLQAFENAAQMKNAKDAATSQAKSANLTNLFDNIGNVGREEYQSNQLQWMKNNGIFGNTPISTLYDDFSKGKISGSDYVNQFLQRGGSYEEAKYSLEHNGDMTPFLIRQKDEAKKEEATNTQNKKALDFYNKFNEFAKTEQGKTFFSDNPDLNIFGVSNPSTESSNTKAYGGKIKSKKRRYTK